MSESFMMDDKFEEYFDKVVSIANYCNTKQTDFGFADVIKNIKKRGLILELIYIYMVENSDKNIQYWIGTCLENFLRGSNAFYQYFVAKTNLLHIVVGDIIANEAEQQIVQTSFDLASEIIKFNLRCFDVLESVLEKGDNYKNFVYKLQNSLTDSNVFIRALILSLYKFREKKVDCIPRLCLLVE